MKTSITKKFKFEAAHFLPEHEGKCKNIHGHSYILEVTVSGPIKETGPATGMVLDFGDLSKVVKEQIITQWDHTLINDLVPFTPTAELLAQEAFKRIQSQNIPVTKVTLYETATSCATVSL